MSKGTTMDVNKLKGGSVGLSYPTLTRENYTAWSMKMRVFMQAHGVWEAVEPSDPKVAVEGKVDKVALAMIYQGIPEDVLLSIADKKTAKDAWDAIKTMSQGADRVKKARIQTLRAEFEVMSMKDSEQLDDFYMRLNGIVSNIRALGEEVKESYVVKKILRAVPAKFLQIASTIEQFGNLETMSVEETIGSLKAHEERVKGQTKSGTNGDQLLLTAEEWAKRESTEQKLLFTREEWQQRTNKSGAEGSSNSKNRWGRDKSRVRCYNCQGFGHYAGECKKAKRERDQRAEANLAQVDADGDEPALLMAECDVKESQGSIMLNEACVVPELKLGSEKLAESSTWYLDNGASNHMSGQRNKFAELDESVKGEVRFGDGSTVNIEGKGSIIFNCKNGEKRRLQEVYYIPSLRNNIISLGQLSEEGNKIVLQGEYLWVNDKQGKLLMKVKRAVNRLYKIDIEDSRPICLLTKAEEISWLWHSRLGHVNFAALALMSRENMAHGLPKIVQPKKVCEGCLMSKQARKVFPSKSEFSASTVLELVHGDICGPFTPPTPAGNRYFLLLVDDCSRYMWIYLLKTKDEAFECFKRFKTLVESRVPESKVKVLRTDRGGEFCSNEFKSYCEEHGIQRHYTAPYSPQQNGVVERRNRTVVEMTRSFLKSMKVPTTLWGEAVRHSIYVLNRLPTRTLTGRTPYEAWRNKKPTLQHVKVFGCVAHVKITGVHQRKLDDRSKSVVYLGSEPGTKAHRFYDPRTGAIVVSRDVIFDETRSWPWESQTCNSTESHMSNSAHVHNYSPFELVGMEDSRNTYGGDGSQSTPSRLTRNSLESTNSETGSTESLDQSHVSSVPSAESGSASSTFSGPKKMRDLSEIYNEAPEVELLDEELMMVTVDEPNSFKQAAEKEEWRRAMKTEIDSIEQNKTWELTELPPGHKAIGLKWVYKLKKDADGNIVKHKARLVAKGYVQQQGIDYDEVFAPVTRLETVRLLLALAAKNAWEVHHLDVKSAFLNGELQEEVYVVQPEGFLKRGQEYKVYKLIKALYGLRQAPRAWYARLSRCLEELGFIRCPYEHAVYTRREGKEVLVVAVYVDDLLITGTNVDNINKFKVEMNNVFDMSDLGKLSYYLGMEVCQGNGYIELKQTGYAKKVIGKAGMTGCNAVKYPMDPMVKLDKDEQGKAVNSTQYKSVVGGLRYLVLTRPDIAYSVGIISRFMERPTEIHMAAAKRIIRYVNGTLDYGLIYSKGDGNYLLSGYSDSDLAGNVDDRRSTGGMAFYLNENLITWVSQKQKCVALSSCESEFMAATAAACQGIWLYKLLRQITNIEAGPVVLYIDNKSAIDLAKNPVFHGRSKHIDIRYHFIRECVERGEIILRHVNTNKQRADVLTKALSRAKFEEMRELLGVKNLLTCSD